MSSFKSDRQRKAVMSKLNPGRSREKITYHGRTGYPVVHETKEGKEYIMVRAKGGGVKRLYEGSEYTPNGKTKTLKLNKREKQKKRGKFGAKKKHKWVSSILSNDEVSTDKELVKHFVDEGEMSTKEAKFYIRQRDKALADRFYIIKKFEGK